ncbi:MAG: bacillithiol biosynthesis cysteine-adding enzyme BshC [Lysinibacillus sp.]
MKLEQIAIPVQNRVLTDYWQANADIHSFFTYPYEQASFIKRAEKLASNEYKRGALVKVIRSYMERFGVSERAAEHLAELEAGAPAIVGGQQAGVFTGPLYSVYKAITVILLANEQRQALGTPVVPIFWIAGEDHDLDEINHTFTIVDGSVKKRAYSKRSHKKTMASTTRIDHDEMERLIRTVFKDYGETVYTEALLAEVLDASRSSETFTDFFTILMNRLFADYGLLMIDAAYGPFRQYESEYFERLIERGEEIARAVTIQEQALEKAGYGKPIGATENNANLFYVEDGERFLLERQEGHFVNSSAPVRLTREELLQTARNEPEKLSNNVVTRPLMQEMTLPVLAFVGGPGELAYWATLKPAFGLLDLEMPIFAPRLNISVVSRKIQPLLEQHRLTFERIVDGEATKEKEQFIASVQDEEALAQVDAMEETLSAQYEALSAHLDYNDLQLEHIVQKNRLYHNKQFAYLKQKIREQTVERHHNVIRQFDLMNAELLPNGGLQERVYNPCQYLNQYGPTFVDDMIELPLVVGPQHFLVKY